MSKFLDLQIKFLSYEASTESNDPSDAIKVNNRVQESSVSEVFRLQTAIADATVDQSITLPDATSEYLLIFSDRNISVKLNGGVTALPLKPKAPGKKCMVLVMKGDITGLSISNASGAPANLDIIMVNV